MLRRVIVYTAFMARLRRAPRVPAALLERALLPWRTAFAVIEDEERLGELRARANGDPDCERLLEALDRSLTTRVQLLAGGLASRSAWREAERERCQIVDALSAHFGEALPVRDVVQSARIGLARGAPSTVAR
jgi:hypothetical protein